MITYADIQRANAEIKTTDIKGKDYAEVPQRIKAFRMVFPEGFIKTDILRLENGVCVMKAYCGFYEDGSPVIMGEGTAYEKEGSTFINKTSYIENCETSAVGRALGMAGFGIDASVASYEEVQTAILNQGEKKATERQLQLLRRVYIGEDLDRLLKLNNIRNLSDLPMAKASELIGKLKEAKTADPFEPYE